VNLFARAGRGPPRGSAVEGLVEEGAEGAKPGNARPSGRARASEFIGGLTVGVSLGSDGVLNAVNSFARAGRGPQRGGALEGLVEEGAEGAETSSASEST
jgi:hypothetical protein